MRIRLLLAVYLLLLAVAVWTPTPPVNPPDPLVPESPMQGLLADLVRNLLLLLPFGWLLSAAGLSLPRAAGLGLLLSLLIETAQAGIPGRHTSPSDVLANAASAAAGAWLHRNRLRWLVPQAAASSWLAWAALVASCAGLLLGAQALRPAPPSEPCYAGLRPELGDYERYAGRVEAAAIGGLDLTQGRIAETEVFAAALRADAPIVLRAELRPSREDAAAIFTIHDEAQHAILVVMADGPDLVVEARTLGRRLGLEQPVHRWVDVLAGRPPERIAELRIERGPGRMALSLDGESMGHSVWRPGSVWALLLPGSVVPGWMNDGLAGTTLALLAFACAYHARRVGWAALGLGLTLLLVPRLAPVVPAAAPEWIGLAVGLALARGARRVAGRTASGSGLSAAHLWC